MATGPPEYTPTVQQPVPYPDAASLPPPQPAQHFGVTQTQQRVVIGVGDCPVCRVGHMQDEFSIGGICLAIVFFPIGVLCCLAMTERRCTHCGAIYR
ncbi:brain protein I3-like [Gigantopelta aegis]|uniref:brain protein I3-like n=1 Tax=Gigantopelta aegis TaxID=1735272 RepID=UPI001B88D884|nr:brain protein I3-like [Gigantopelta aegis]XP_041362403.1 brain protein I3-like [Gigantopelta aegis]XP_041362404.1 brain protein I3-like [Gigantopelta aegis]XP_041362405.1 brain protein I3-like [Gigantopelta aegis]